MHITNLVPIYLKNTHKCTSPHYVRNLAVQISQIPHREQTNEVLEVAARLTTQCTLRMVAVISTKTACVN